MSVPKAVMFAAVLLLAASASRAEPNEAAVPATAPFVLETGRVDEHPEWRFTDLAVDLTRAELVVVDQAGGASLAAMVPEGAWAAFNGGYFTKELKPTGWARDRQHVLGPKLKGKRGGVIAISGEKIYIGPQGRLSFEPEFAIHNGPLLIEADGSIGIRSDDGRRASRTTVCLVGKAKAKNRTLHVILIQAESLRGPTLMETAKLLAKQPSGGGFGCSVALNLDGGPSTGLWLKPGTTSEIGPPLTPIAYGIAIKGKRLN